MVTSNEKPNILTTPLEEKVESKRPRRRPKNTWFKDINSFTANSQYIGEVEWSRFTDRQFIGEVSKLVRPVKSLCVS